MNTQIRLPLIAIGCIALVTASCSHKKSGASDEAPVIDVAAVTVDSVTVHRSFPAYLTANRSVDLVARVNSTLTSRRYKEGDFVKEGTVLFTFDPTQYAEAVSRARAALDDAEASYRYAADHYAAVEKALESDAVSRMEVLQAKSAKEAAEASIASARAQLKTAETTLSYCTVRAPFDGHVSMSEYSAGAYLAGEGAPIKLCTIYDDAVVLVNFSIDNTEFAKLKAKADSSGIGAMLHASPSSSTTRLNTTIPPTFIICRLSSTRAPARCACRPKSTTRAANSAPACTAASRCPSSTSTAPSSSATRQSPPTSSANIFMSSTTRTASSTHPSKPARQSPTRCASSHRA